MYSFLSSLVKESMIKIAETTKKHPQDMELPTLDAMRCAVSEHEVLRTEEDKLFESVLDGKGMGKTHDSR